MIDKVCKKAIIKVVEGHMRKSSIVRNRLIGKIVVVGALFNIAFALPGWANTNTSGIVRVNTEVETAISMAIVGNDDDGESCSEGRMSCSTFGEILPNTYATTASTISVFTNSVDGYYLSVKAAENANLRSENDGVIRAGILADEVGGLGVWSFKTDGTGVINNWSAMTTDDAIIKGTSEYDTDGDETTVTYGLSTDDSQTVGRYATTLVYTATAPNETTVKEPTLLVNLSEGISGAQIRTGSLTGTVMGIAKTSGETVKINADEKYYIVPMYQSGYTLDEIVASSNTETVVEDVNSYGYYVYTPVAGETHEVTLSGKRLTAAVTDSSLLAMQDLSIANCPAMPTAVRDSRDNAVYYIQRLVDGNCWMLENLRLGGGSAMTLTAADSNIESEFTLPASGVTCFNVASVTNCDGSGDNTHNGYTVPAVNTASKTTIVTGYGAGRNYVGDYYNYCAASAKTVCTNSAAMNSTYDICPAKWAMPTGNTAASSQYKMLAAALGITGFGNSIHAGFSNEDAAIYHNTLSLPLSGAFYQGSVRDQNVNGYFWSASGYSSTSTYFLSINSNDVFPQGANHRDLGYPVRCVLK